MNLLDDLRWRGLLHQVTDADFAKQALQDQKVTAYIGFDPTAASLHVGSLLQIVLLARLGRAGHTPIAVVGGGTGRIGDPSGKTAERKLLSDADVTGNVAAIHAQIGAVLDNAGVQALRIDNADWLCSQDLIGFLRDVGKHFSVNAMIARDSVKNRLEAREQGISYTEFSYMLLQAFDFVELYRRHGCMAQFGGSDQWGNIVSGIDLIDRLERRADGSLPHGPAFGVTVPLVTTKSGQKFGKTEAGAVWLDADLTSPYQFYQFWMNSDDDDALRYLAYFTFIKQDEYEALKAAHLEAPHQRQAQRRLADEVTALVHPQQLPAVQAAVKVLFGGNPLEADLATLQVLQRELPTCALPADASVEQLLVGDNRPFASNSEARRAVAQNAVTISGQKFTSDLRAPVPAEAWLRDRYVLVRKGKKDWFLAART
ncbi:MAG: tyrosine--tRNA ligase [Deltaproteobacteria bacterium]|nr:tyrosine--tRNA ligase [Deltaproteobacteria bacterium]